MGSTAVPVRVRLPLCLAVVALTTLVLALMWPSRADAWSTGWDWGSRPSRRGSCVDHRE